MSFKRFVVVSLIWLLSSNFSSSLRGFSDGLVNNSTELVFTQDVQTAYTKAKLSLDHRRIRPNQVLWAELELTHKQGWHSYWKNPGDSGLETTLVWTSSHQFDFEPIVWQSPEIFYLDDLVNYGYKEKVKLLMPLKVASFQHDKNTSSEYVKLSALAEWLVCEDVCIPEQARFNFLVELSNDEIEKSDSYNSIRQTKEIYFNRSSVQIDTIKQGNTLHLDMSAFLDSTELSKDIDVYFFADQPGYIRATKTQELIKKNQKTYLILEQEQEKTSLKSGLLRIRSSERERVFVSNIKSQTNLFSIVIFFGFACLGGLLLNVMPCVFPVLSLKALSLVQEAKLNPRNVRIQSLSYCLGVLISFYLLIVLLQLLSLLGYYVGWGFQLQSPTFIFGLIVVMMLVGLHLNNLLYTPRFLLNAQRVFGGLKLNSQHNTKHFFTGVLAVFIASPCTAPLMAPALGFALSQHFFIQILIFTGLALGFSCPFLIIGFFPVTQKYLPKSGPWLDKVKHILALPMYATVLWLMWVLYNQIGFLACVIGLIFFALVFILILVQKITFQHQRLKDAVTAALGLSFFILLGVCSLIPLNKSTLNTGTVFDIKDHLNNQRRVFVDVIFKFRISWIASTFRFDKSISCPPKFSCNFFSITS